MSGLGNQGAYDLRLVKDVLAEKDAEIERLKAQVKELSEAYQKAIGPIQPAKDAELKALITEMADVNASHQR
jgi:archaellum component FlaC